MNNPKHFKYFIKKAFISGIRDSRQGFLFEEEEIPNTETPPSESEIKNSVINFLSTIEQSLKFKSKLSIGANVINNEKTINSAADKISKDLLNASVDVSSFSKSVQQNISKSIANLEKDIKNVAAKEQQKQQQKKQQQEQQKEETITKENYNYFPKKYLVERDDPISVSSIKGILKFTSQDKIADVIKKMEREDFLNFIDGLQKTALDALAKGIENIESSSGEEESEEEKETEEEEKEEGTEGNLKLDEL